MRHGTARWILMVAFVTAAGAASAGEIPDNPAGGAITHHSMHAAIDPATAGLTVVDTLTIRHRPATPASQKFPFLLSSALQVDNIEGIGISVVGAPKRLAPRDYWREPPYDELGGYERARSFTVAPTQADGTWPESIRIVVRYHGAVYDSLRAPKSAYARGFEDTSGLIDPRGAFLSGAHVLDPVAAGRAVHLPLRVGDPGGLAWDIAGGPARDYGWRDAGSTRGIAPSRWRRSTSSPGPIHCVAKTRAGVDVQTFTYANTDSALCARYMNGTERYLELYDAKIGPYPFAKFALVENFWQTGFGMPSFTLAGRPGDPPALHPRHLVRARDPAQLVGQRRLRRLPRRATGARGSRPTARTTSTRRCSRADEARDYRRTLATGLPRLRERRTRISRCACSASGRTSPRRRSATASR